MGELFMDCALKRPMRPALAYCCDDSILLAFL